MKQKDMNMSKNDKPVDNVDSDTEDDQLSKEGPIDSELQNIIEAALFASKSPLGIKKITALFPEDAQPSKVDIQNVVMSLQEQCQHRGVELLRIGTGWRYQTKEKYSPWLRKLSGQKAPRYSRALLETLSIIAYRQPVTRGDIEEIRGVGVSSDTIRTLEERDWVAQIGHRDVPGRPALFGTTQGFLEYFNMESLRELPELIDKRELGEIAKDMNLTLPMDGVQGDTEAAQLKEEADAKSAEVIELHPEAQDAEDAPESNLGDSAQEGGEGSVQESSEENSSSADAEDHDAVADEELDSQEQEKSESDTQIDE